MKAMCVHAYGGAEKLTYEDVAMPEIGPQEVLIKVRAASVNPIDCKLANGAMRPVMNNQPVGLPWVPGGDFAGVVEKTGTEVSHVRKGDAVYGNCPSGGAYAEFVRATGRHVALKPQALDFVQAASVPLAAQTAWQALFDYGHLNAGQDVLIHGAAGGVGSFAVQLAKWKNARVWATASPPHFDFLRSLGADHLIDYKATRFESVVKPVDLVLDLIGGQTQERSFQVVKPSGYLVSTVNSPSKEQANQHQIHALMMSMKPSLEILQALSVLLEAGSVRVNVAKVYALAQAKRAWEDILSHHTFGKIVLEVV